MGKTDLVSFGQIFEKKGTLSLIEAEPSEEKTGFGFSLLRSLTSNGKSGTYMVLEQKGTRIMSRLVSLLHTLNLTDEELSPISFWDMKAPLFSTVVSAIERWHQKGNADIVYIDYLNLIRPEGKELLSELKAIAIKFDIPIIGMVRIPIENGEVNIDSPYIDNLYCLKMEYRKVSLIDLKGKKDMEFSYDPKTTGFKLGR